METDFQLTKEEAFRLALESIQRWTLFTNLDDSTVLRAIGSVVDTALREE